MEKALCCPGLVLQDPDCGSERLVLTLCGPTAVRAAWGSWAKWQRGPVWAACWESQGCAGCHWTVCWAVVMG